MSKNEAPQKAQTRYAKNPASRHRATHFPINSALIGGHPARAGDTFSVSGVWNTNGFLTLSAPYLPR